MKYLEVEDVAELGGLRLVLTRGMPGPWGLAAKALFEVKGLDYVAAAQYPGKPNRALARLTGQTSAPVALYDDEPPKTLWSQIVWLSERLAPQPKLVPDDVDTRALMFGLIGELAGENGYGWCRRLMTFDQIVKASPLDDTIRLMCSKYGYSTESAAAAPQRCVAILQALAARLQAQRKRGSDYFIGDALTALDLYWATFSAMYDPLAQEVNPMPSGIREYYLLPEELRRRVDPILLEHRDRIYERHLNLPLDYLPDADDA